MSDLDREAIRARADAATKGPWFADDTDLKVNTEDGRALVVVATVLLSDEDTRENYPQASADAEFIAAVRDDVAALLDELDRVSRELETMREVARGNKEHVGFLTRELERLQSPSGGHAASWDMKVTTLDAKNEEG
jgi:hypothetical protein